MKKFIALGCMLSIISSCSFIEQASSGRIRNDFYSKISNNSSPEQVYALAGPSLMKLEIDNKKMLFYQFGFVEFTNDIVSRKGFYEGTYNSAFPFSSNVKIGANVFDTCTLIGKPKNIQFTNGNYILTYKNGAVRVEGQKLAQVADKLFDNDLQLKLGINAFSEMSVKQASTYMLLPGDKDISPEDLQYKEVKQYMEHSMTQEGMNLVNDIKKADYIVLIKYGISDPKEDIKVISRPVFIPTFVPGQTATFYNGFGGMATLHTGGSWRSQYAGQSTETIKTISYNRWLNAEAFDNKVLQETKTLKPVWKVLSNSIGPLGDLRVIVPALTYGVGNYVNKDTQKQLDFQIDAPTINSYIFDTKLKSKDLDRDVASKK